MRFQKEREKILIVDFGSQITKLIGRNIRELGVYSEILTPQELKKLKDFEKIKGVILSGGPSSVTSKKFPTIPKQLFEKKIPILGICYGLQLIAKLFGGKIKPSKTTREFGRAYLIKKNRSLLTKNFLKKKTLVWMSHEDAVVKLPLNFKVIASTNKSKLTIIEHLKKNIYGVQFHPEVTHTNNGKQIFKNFLFLICKVKKNWNIPSQKIRLIKEIQKKVKNDKVICALSGGVDSSVAALLINRAIKKKLICIMVDTGLMRKNEFKDTYRIFKKKYKLNVKLIDASKLFLKKLKYISDPEKKRKVIGKLFIRVFESEAKKYKNIKFLAQGTLYPDIIESRSSTGSKTSKIKSHHNVGGLPKKMNLKIVEPLKELFKDEVRLLGKKLKISSDLINRHPFPGPGLAIRIPGEIDRKKIDILQRVDNQFITYLKEKKIYKNIWQAFAILLPVKSVGVMGDERTYNYSIALRAVTSVDGMTSDFYMFSKEDLTEISKKIISNVKEVNRVLYDFTSKPPGTIEWE